MQQYILAFLISILYLNTNAQSATNDSTAFKYVEVSPEYPGGDAELIRFLVQNVRYPQYEMDRDIQGRVMVRFVVMEDGSVDSVTVTKSVSPGLDAEAVRVVKLLSKFKPGTQDGKAVRVYFNLPVGFNLTSNAAKPRDNKKKKNKH